MVRKLIGILFLCALLTPLYGQKVKYKDLFVLLNAKQYEQAEPFLRIYLADNEDNPNAYLFMGIILQEKAGKTDVLKQTDLLISQLDSAVFFYDKANKQLDEKEVKRNDEYYQAYNRRDLRTGKFGVKLSDVQFDLEKKMEALKERKSLVKELKVHYDNAESLYSKANFLYKDIQLRFGNLKTLYFRSDQTNIEDLKRIASVYDSSLKSFSSYKSISNKLGNTGYNQLLALKEIKELDKDGDSSADFTKDDLELWNYKAFSEATITKIENEIEPIWDNLNAYDVKINKLREKLTTDSVSVKEDLRMMADRMISAQLKMYDPDPFPLDIFEMKIAELEYLSEVIANSQFKDSVNYKLHADQIKSELKELNKLDSVTEKLMKRNFDNEAKDYMHFITNAYGNPIVLKSLIRTMLEFANREQARKQNTLKGLTNSMRWIVSATDSIPLFMDVTPESKFIPLVIVEEKYTAGFQFADSTVTGYFMTINPARVVGVKAEFPVDKTIFSRRKMPVTKAMSTSDENGQVFYILTFSEEKKEDKFPVTLAKIYRTDGLAWCSTFAFEMQPTELAFQIQTGEVSIKTSNSAGESKMIFVDKSGSRKDLVKQP
ncbi:MAG TPA: hypothetical protein VIS49_04345 [Cyclobacteriaceae bacterium]